jgi:hypothetical protein
VYVLQERDRVLPIAIKEYLEEVRNDHISWEHMPRRILRHRVIHQCARLEFNISSGDHIYKKPKGTNIKKHRYAEEKVIKIII